MIGLMADEHACRDRNPPQRSRSTQNRLKETASQKFLLNFDRARSAPSGARFSPATIVLTFSRLIITQTKIRLSNVQNKRQTQPPGCIGE